MRAGLVVLLGGGCGKPRPAQVGAESPANSATSPGPGHPAPGHPDEPLRPGQFVSPWCSVPVVSLRQPAEVVTLGDALRTTAAVGFGRVILSEADCSGIGHYHVAVQAEIPAAFGIAYASCELGTSIPRAARYLVGVEPTDPRRVDLSSVCVGFSREAGADLRWLVPIPDDADLERSEPELKAGLCPEAG